VSENFNNKIAQIFYGIIVLMISLANVWMYACLRRANPDDQKIAQQVRGR
jgi:uncharacterized membrane protein